MNLQSSDFSGFKALANPLRVRMLVHLEDEHTVKQVADEMGMRPHTLYHHVKVLEDCGVVKLVRRKKRHGSIEEKFYRLTDKYRRRESPDPDTQRNQKSVLEHMLSVIAEYCQSIDANPEALCHSCNIRLAIRSADAGKIKEDMNRCAQQFIEEQLKPYAAVDGDVTFVFSALGFLR
jgi:DNA-binding transcriptional ArsR family regulator